MEDFLENLRIISPVSIRSFPGVLSKWLLMTAAVRVNTSLILRTASPLEPFSQCPEMAPTTLSFSLLKINLRLGHLFAKTITDRLFC